jgi:hypothetical protein
MLPVFIALGILELLHYEAELVALGLEGLEEIRNQCQHVHFTGTQNSACCTNTGRTFCNIRQG